MFKHYGFYFPDAQFLADPEGLLKYLVRGCWIVGSGWAPGVRLLAFLLPSWPTPTACSSTQQGSGWVTKSPAKVRLPVSAKLRGPEPASAPLPCTAHAPAVAVHALPPPLRRAPSCSTAMCRSTSQGTTPTPSSSRACTPCRWALRSPVQPPAASQVAGAAAWAPPPAPLGIPSSTLPMLAPEACRHHSLPPLLPHFAGPPPLHPSTPPALPAAPHGGLQPVQDGVRRQRGGVRGAVAGPALPLWVLQRADTCADMPRLLSTCLG